VSSVAKRRRGLRQVGIERQGQRLYRSTAAAPQRRTHSYLTRQLELVLVRNDKLIPNAYKRLRAEQITSATVNLPPRFLSTTSLTPAARNIYGVFPPDLSPQELEFAELLDTARDVEWWHRNPVRKPESVALYRWAEGIGFFPDVGATFFLPRLPAAFGIYCALTGERLDAADAVAAGVATHRVPSAQFPDLIETLCRAVPLDASLAACARSAAHGPVVSHRTAIETLFTGEQVEDILAALDAAGAAGAAGGADAAFASAAVALIRTKSPTSLKIALAQMRRGSALDFAECMRTEFRIVSRVVRGHDFYEGIRAVIIDKDQAPRWQPSTLAAVSAAEVERHFAPLASELELP